MEKRIIVLGMSPYRGGMESYIMNIFREIVKYGYFFDFYLPHDCPKTAFEDEILALGGKLYRCGYGRMENIFLHYKNVEKVLSSENVIGVYINTCVLDDIVLLKKAKKLKKPVRIIHAHNSDYMSSLSLLKKYLVLKNKKKLNNYANLCLACSDNAGNWMFGELKYQVIQNGIDVTMYSFKEDIRNKIRVELCVSDKLVVGAVGRIQYQKNPEFILDIFEQVYRINNNSILLWAGSGSNDDIAIVKSAIKEKKLENNVKMLGMVDNVNELYNAFDAFILPSRFEGLPFVLIEAQCNGVPCFVSNTITKEADITGRIHFLPIIESARSWAKTIVENINIIDRQNAYLDILNNKYSINASAEKLLKLIKDCENV